ncbi:flagellar biosynthesis protein FlhF [Alienimonas californiensis]|uniref:Flagellar biosynthesis protein FlhF n=1 Tax=Alienimonas californiensis TaxID=2527989 RepID=A0A517PCJ1_9PLAN|nr:hypothetical protein [Alienimonas californiensis]QDT17099.1 Flagellar biosynthesis protein FlhF [Alienimonas californiensis]
MSEIRTFRAATMRDALRRVRDEFGPDAALLSSRTLPGAKREVEVTAEATVSSASRGRQPSEKLDPRTAHAANIVRELTRTGALPTAPPASQRALFARLTARDFAPASAQYYVDNLGDAPLADVAAVLAEDLPICGGIASNPHRRTVAAFVGPTGVGKTTTLAKLAARLSLRSGRKVGLVTADTYRIGAVEQLATYARILAAPFEVAADAAALTRALSKLRGCDVVLIDTAGRAPRDDAHLSELAALLSASAPDGARVEAHLVLSVAAGERALLRAALRYGRLRPASLVLSKLDEAEGAGAAVELLRTAPPAPVSTLTFGQDVPDDLCEATPANLAAACLGDWEPLLTDAAPGGRSVRSARTWEGVS